MTCPCSNPCPDDGEFIPVTPISPDTPLPTETLDSDECCTGGCGCGCGCPTGCHDNCGINIQSTSECLTVDTSECGVVKLTPICPPEVVAGDNITVDVVDSPREGYSKRYIVNSECEDTKVKVKECGDEGYLDELITEGDGIKISSSCNNMEISVDWDDMPAPEPIPDITVTNNSQLVTLSPNGHHLTISDIDNKAYYAKLVLGANHIWVVPANQEGVHEAWLGEKAPVVWKNPKQNTDRNIDVRNSLNHLMIIDKTTFSGGWAIKTTKKGLYHVGFSGAAEFSYGIHAFRVQMYRIPKNDVSKLNTIVESRYSGPLGYEPWQDVVGGHGKIHYVSGISGGGGESAPTAQYSDYNIDYPLIGEKTEAENIYQDPVYSASMGAILDRVPVTGNTIVEMDKDDWLIVGLKISTSIRHSGSLMKDINGNFLSGHFALLGADVEGGDNGPEAGFSFFADLIHPLY